MLTEIHVPTGGHGGAAYVKHPHPASRFAVCGVAAAVALDGTGKCKSVHVGITGVGSKAVRAKGVEAALAGKTPDAATIAGFADPKRGWERLYVDHVLQADTGADLDFLVGSTGSDVSRESH